MKTYEISQDIIDSAILLVSQGNLSREKASDVIMHVRAGKISEAKKILESNRYSRLSFKK